ncbi:MAG: O-antigen ligase family protein [Desulfuromonadales bacterium]|nr:O-antigen ligase family protein [Desulfuromonadales bacterium]
MATVFVNFFILTSSSYSEYSGIWGNIFVYGRFQGSFENANMAAFAFYVGLCFSFLFLENKNIFLKFISIACIVFSIVLIISTASKKGLILLCITIIILIIYYIKKLARKDFVFITYSALIISIIGIFVSSKYEIVKKWEYMYSRWSFFISEVSVGFSNETSTGERINFIRSGMEMFWNSPIFGHGLNSFSYFHNGTYSHCNYIELLFNGGIVAFILFYSIHYYSIKNTLKMASINFKSLLLLIVFSLLIMDVAAVTYDLKLYLYLLLLVTTLPEQMLAKEQN